MTEAEASPRTPRIIFVAIALLLMATAAPSIGSFLQGLDPNSQDLIIGPFVVWVLLGVGLGGLGILCTIIGAWRPPRTAATFVAILLGSLWLFAVVTIAVLLFA